MRSAFCLILFTPFLGVFGQNSSNDGRIEQGARIFTANCSVPYCHGPNGTAGRAPKLLGHSFEVRALAEIVSNGIASKGMPRFEGQLSPRDLEAVVAYVMTLRGSSAETPAAASASTSVRELPGKALFFDATRLGGCGRCHELENRGSRIAESIKSVPSDLRTVSSVHTVTISPKGEASFPGLVLEQSQRAVRVYDLSSTLPVLRTFEPGGVEVTKGSHWSHQDAIAGYSDAELNAIVDYLQSTIRR